MMSRTRTRGLLITIGVCCALPVSADSAIAGGCAASAVRVVNGAQVYEPVRANPAFSPCVADHQDALRSSVAVASGAVKVSSSSLNATTQADHPSDPAHPYEPGTHFIFGEASSDVDSVTITSGPNTITASDLQASVVFGCYHGTVYCYPYAGSRTAVALVSVNGIVVGYGPDPVDVPVPGVGTLHINWTGFPYTTNRALWLEGSPGNPDVVVAEARAFCQMAVPC